MKIKIFQIVVLLFSAFAFAQFDQGNKFTPIPPANGSGGNFNIAPEKNPSIFDVKPTKEATILWGKEEKSVFEEKEKFVNPGDKYLNKLNKRNAEGSGDYKVYRRHQFFGDFRTKSKNVKIIYRDPQTVDGDFLRIYHNEKVIRDQINLVGSFVGFTYELEEGFNKFDFEALNEGQYFPNTGEFSIVIDGEVIYNSEWNLATGFKATFIIVKEE